MYICCDWKCAFAYCNDTYTADCYLIANASPLCLACLSSPLPPFQSKAIEMMIYTM